MNIAALTAIRTVLGPMTSEAKCREVYEAVLLSVREPSEAICAAMKEAMESEDFAPTEWESRVGYRTAIDALLAE